MVRVIVNAYQMECLASFRHSYTLSSPLNVHSTPSIVFPSNDLCSVKMKKNMKKHKFVSNKHKKEQARDSKTSSLTHFFLHEIVRR